MPPVAKPVPAIASIKAEPVPQTAKGDDGKEFLYATKVSLHHLMLAQPAIAKKKNAAYWHDTCLHICSLVCCQYLRLYQTPSEHVTSLLLLHGSAGTCLDAKIQMSCRSLDHTESDC